MKSTYISISIALALSLNLLTGCGSSSDTVKTTPQPDPVTPVNYQALLDSTVGQDVPGLILSIVGADTEFLGAAGYADIDSFEPMQVFHQMPAGSAGKKAIALLTALLHEDGMLNIDDLISTWLPSSILDNIPHSDQITIRQLLNHTAGVHDYLDADTSSEWFEAGINSIGELKTDIDALRFIYNKPAYFAPGQGVQYSNSGYLLTGLILDEVLGEHHHTALRNRVLIPLGLNNTYYSGLENELGTSISGYILDDGEMLNTKPFYESVGVADAPLVTTANDLSALLRAIITDQSVVTDDIRNILFGPDSLVSTQYGFDFGLGLFKEDTGAGVVFHHGGDEAGYKISNSYSVDADTVITLFANCNAYTACIEKTDALMETLSEAVFSSQTNQ